MCFVVVVVLLHKKTESVRILAEARIDVWFLCQINLNKTVRQFKAGHTRQLCDNLTVCFKGQTIVICHITAKCMLCRKNSILSLRCKQCWYFSVSHKSCRKDSCRNGKKLSHAQLCHTYCMLSVASTPAVTGSDSDYFWDECYTVYIDTFLLIFFLRASPICIFASRCIYNI